MKRSICFIIATLLLAMTGERVFAESIPVGRLSYLEGRVDKKTPLSAVYLPMTKDGLIYAGDIIRTKGDSRTEISFNDASSVKVGENSQLQVKDYVLREDGSREKAELFLDRGVLRAIVSKSTTGEQNFSIDTPNAGGTVKGSDIGVSYLKSSSTFLAMSGAIMARHSQFADKTVLIEKGATAFVPAESPAQDARPFLAAEADRFRDDTAPLLARDANITAADLSKAIITDTLGDVRVKAKGSEKWHRAALKETLGEGDEIETGENGGLRMVLESGRIVELGPDTQLSIDKFSVDEKNQSREDLLSSKKGEIRARIDKLKGNSKFQVTTPTAIASVRGTIMYLSVSPELTKAFFEAGQGALASILNGVEKAVDPGQNAQADKDGNVSDPITTTIEQHQSLEGSFNSLEQSYSLTSLDDSMASVFDNIMAQGDLGGFEGMQGQIDENMPDNQDQLNSDIFQGLTDIADLIFSGEVFAGDVRNGNFSFYFVEGGTSVAGHNRGSDGFYQTGSLTGAMAGVGDFADAAHDTDGGSTSLLYSGTFNIGFIPNTQAVLWGFDIEGVGIRGLTGGISIDGDVEGNTRFIYISKDTLSNGSREAGIATGTVDGLFVGSGNSGSWLFTADLSSTQKGTTHVAPDDLLDNLETTPLLNVGKGKGDFNGSGALTLTSFKGNAYGLNSVGWGIWGGLLYGTNSAATAGSFKTSFSGLADDTSEVQSFKSDSVVLGKFEGTWDSADKMSGAIDAIWVSEPNGDAFLEAGTLKGEAIGNASGNYGSWQASTVGQFDRTTASLQLNQVKNYITTNGASLGIAEVVADARNYAFSGGQFNGASGSITGSMDTSFYGSAGNASTNGIWASLISGSFSGMPGSVTSWAANLKVGTDPVEAALTGVSWADGKWVATVAGNSSAPVDFSGQAGGTYTFADGSSSSGTFAGAGVGTWQEQVVG